MESANLHHQHQLQDQLVGSSSLSIPTCYGVGTTNHTWTPTITVNTGNFNPNSDGVFSNPRDSRQYNDIHVPSLNSSMVQDLGFHWISNAGCFTSSPTDQSAHDLHLAKIKEELSESIPKFTEMLNSSSSIDQDYHLNHPTASIKDDQKDHLSQEFNEKLLMKTVSSRGFYSNSQNLHSFGGAAMPSRGNFSQIYPSINISNVNQSPSPSAISSSLDMNLHALDLLTSERYSGSSFSQLPNSHDSLGVFKDSPSGLENMQQLTHRLSSNPSNISLFTNRVREAKRPGSLMEAKSSQAAPKKPRLESRASCPPFKVRKEKLGDRIAALQQLVAPFGKTDTASVLMEAIGYIKFLQSQVETLSVPYMKSSRNKTACRTMQVGLVNDGNEEPKRDLRSRGLCLVPLSCMSYVTGDSGGGGVWPPTPNYGGGT